MKLQPIAKEAAACRATWAAVPDATAGVHIHHEIAAEKLTEPIESRIAYILAEKPKKEQALRLRLMRPVTAAAWAEYDKVAASARAEYDKVVVSALAEYNKVVAPVKAPARAEYDKVRAAAHLAICPTRGCLWDGRTIFAKGTK